ncbi:MAG: sigma-70 family RNA polymerase sigma factor [Gemmatimonadetes bacterium]|nr:sigma-70 family RNA polymerase sigma factor [Gemmatimonadota bacterium]
MTAEADRLFRTYHATLVRYLTRRLGDRDWAEEVAQETFVRALRQPPTSNERSWLFAVANNLVRDEARKSIRQRSHLQLLAAEERERESSGPDTGEEMTPERAHEMAMARRALDSIAERDRQALLLKAEGLDYDEIAGILGIEKSSVGTTLSRARRRLAETFDALRTGKSGLADANTGRTGNTGDAHVAS